MWGRKEEKPKRRPAPNPGARGKPGGGFAQFGLLDIPDVSNMSIGGGMDDDENDEALEAELLALTGGGGTQPRQKRGGRNLGAPELLDRMVSDCMKDYDDEDVSDSEDPDLLAELSMITSKSDPPASDNMQPFVPVRAAPPVPPSDPSPKPVAPAPVILRPAPMTAGSSVLALLLERQAMYQEAEANAKANGETARARRFVRGLKNIDQMIKSVKAGRAINEEDIPPVVIVKHSGGSGGSSGPVSPSADSIAEPSPNESPSSEVSPAVPPAATIPQNVVFNTKERLDPNPAPNPAPKPKITRQASQPEQPAAPSDPSGENCVSVIRGLRDEYKVAALAAKRNGNTEFALFCVKVMKQLEPVLTAAENGQSVAMESLPPPPSAISQSKPQLTPPVAESTLVQTNSKTAAPGPPPSDQSGEESSDGPRTVIEALEQRMAKYTQQMEKAKNEGNARKERMNQRIIKQYQDAIKAHKAGRPVAFDELPTPPGFPPIPTGNPAPPGSDGGPSVAKQSRPAAEGTAVPKGPAPKPQPAMNVRNAPQSRVEKQLALLTNRQQQFRKAALDAKKHGELEQAKEYLRMSKGFDQLIEATKSGLPVDMNTVPVPPKELVKTASVDFEMVSVEECQPPPSGDAAETFAKLEEDLISQIKMCAETREHFKAIGDVASANRFEQLILHTKKDLDATRAAFRRSDAPPRFHYETRAFNIVRCNTELNDSDCEVNVLRGINYNVENPKDVDTFIKIEFPYPSDNPPQDRTTVVKDTNNPEYNHKIVFSIDRKTRTLARVFKRHSIKLQVVAKGGWFQRDTVVGTVKVPLVPLETKCVLHESYDLMDDRKRMVGGKVEVKIRLRNPILSKQLEKITERWLVIDGF